MQKVTYILKCRFCGKEMGDVQVITQVPVDQLTDEMLNIEDNRCSDCEALYGNFKEMSQIYMQETGNTYDQFKVDVANVGWKKADLDSRIEEIKSEQQNDDGQPTA